MAGDETGALGFLSGRELLRQRALAARAERRGRAGAAAMRARIEAELSRRRDARLDRAAAAAGVPLGPAAPTQGALFDAIDPVEDPLRIAWRDLVERRLPVVAAERGWPIQEGHCFARALLDAACGRPWRERIRPPAWRNAPAALLGRALALGEQALSGRADMGALNRASLEMRAESAGRKGRI